MELRHLRVFVAIAELCSFSKAAVHLNKTQPGLTRTIAELEEELEVRLFDRSKRQIRLTDAGTRLLDVARHTLSSLENGLVSVKSVGQDLPLRIGFNTEASYTIVPKILKAFTTLSPGTPLSLQEMDSIDQERLLRNDQLDIGFMLLPFEDDWPHKVVAELHSIVALPEHHPCAQKSTVTFSDLANDTIIMFPRHLSPMNYDRVVECLATAPGKATVIQEAPRFSTALGYVAAGIGVAVGLSFAQESYRREGVVFRPLCDPVLSFELGVVWRDATPVRPVAAFLTAVSQVLHEKELSQWSAYVD